MSALEEQAADDVDERRPAEAPVGLLLGFGAVCAMLLAGLGVLRAEDQTPGLLWLSGAGSAALLLGPALLGAHALRPKKRALIALLCGPLAALGPLMLLGQVIKSATNHRPLGAMTYAVVASGVLVGVWLVVVRLLGFWERGGVAWLRQMSGLAGTGLVLGSLALSVMSLRHLGVYFQPVLLDGALVVVAGLSACFIDLRSRLARMPTSVGWALWSAVVLGGLVATVMLGERLVAVSLPLSFLSLLISA